MEAVMTDDIRRHPDGGIDFDLYRARSNAMRRKALRDSYALRLGSIGVVTMLALASFVAVIVATPAPDRHASATVVHARFAH
jgi:hypothetical protein